MYRHILVPLDTSELAECALPHAAALANASGARITLLSVVSPTGYPIGPGAVPALGPHTAYEVTTDPDWQDDERKRVSAYLDDAAREMTIGNIKIDTVVETGDPASLICDFARERDIDLIIMSSHGRTGLARWVFGSVAGRVVQAADVPTLIVRACVADIF